MKKLIISSLLISVLALSFAFATEPSNPSSKKSESTQGLFTTDVDDYFNVVDWSNVNPDHLFGFLGYDTSIGGINWGLAHEFSSFYTAAYFGGKVDGLSIGTKKVSVTDGDTTTTKTTESDQDGDFDTGILFGFENIGIKLAVHVNINDNTNSKTDTDPVVISKEKDFDVCPVLSFGITGNKLGNWDSSYTGYAGVDCNIDKTIDIAGTEDSTDKSEYVVKFGGGIGLSQEKDALVHNIDVSLGTDVSVYPKKTSSKIAGDTSIATYTYGRSNLEMNLNPVYTLTYNASEKLTLKFRAVEDIKLEFNNDYDYAEADGNKAYNGSRTSSTEISLTPVLSAGISYQLNTKKYQLPVYLNAGIGLSAPVCGLSFEKQLLRDTTDGKVNQTTNTSSFFVNQRTGYCSWSSGFTFVPAKAVTIDASYNILANLLGNDFETDFAEGYSANIWETANKAIVHNIAVLVSVKF